MYAYSIKSQSSIEKGKYDTQAGSPPTQPAPEPPSNPPDIVPHVLYEEVNTLTRKVYTLVSCCFCKNNCSLNVCGHVLAVLGCNHSL